MRSFPHHCLQSPSRATTYLDFPPSIDCILLTFEDCLKLLVESLFSQSGTELEKHDWLVRFSHTIHRTYPAERFLALGHQGDELHQAIGLLGRLRSSFRVFLMAAWHVDGFDELDLIQVVSPKDRQTLPSKEWSLKQTFHALGRQVDDVEVDRIMGRSNSKRSWTGNKLRDKFSRLKSPTWEMHAEVQLILFILDDPQETANGKEFDYIGCSRYSCLLCSRFLDHLQGIKTRGCHGKLYNHSWTVLLGEGLGKEEQQIIFAALTKLTSWMRKELIESGNASTQTRPQVKESTAGSTSIVLPRIDQDDHTLNYAISEHLRRQQAEILHAESNQARFALIPCVYLLPLLVSCPRSFSLPSLLY